MIKEIRFEKIRNTYTLDIAYRTIFNRVISKNGKTVEHKILLKVSSSWDLSFRFKDMAKYGLSLRELMTY